MKRVSILTTLLILTACADAAESPTPSPSPTATATLTPSATATPSTTPTPTATPTPSNTPPPTVTPTITSTPEFHNPNPGGDIFFTPYDDDDCQLPCWQGLQIGLSDIGDVQNMFERVFYLPASPQSVKRVYDNSIGEYAVAGTKYIRYSWEFQSPGYSVFEIDVIFDIDTDLLQGIHITQFPGAGTILNPYTPAQMIKEVGTPTSVYVNPIVRDYAILTLLYKEGLVFEYFMDASVFENSNGNEIELRSKFCLNGRIQTTNYYIIRSFELEKGKLYPERWFGKLQLSHPSDIVLGLSAEEIGEMALQSDNPCFTIEEPE